MANYRSYAQAPTPYVYGLGLANNATTPTTALDVAVGSILDSTKTFQMNLNDALVVNAANVGVNGLDTGALAASTVYYVYLIGGTSSGNVPAGLISALDTPYLPFGYDIYAKIGYVVTGAGSTFLKGYWTDDLSSWRTFMFDAPQATSVVAGSAVAYTTVDLSTLVPAIDNTPVIFNVLLTPAAVADTFDLKPFGATGTAISVKGQVIGVSITDQVMVFAKDNAGAPAVSYRVTGGGAGAADLDVGGYQFAV